MLVPEQKKQQQKKQKHKTHHVDSDELPCMLGYTEIFTSVSGRYLVSTFQAF